MKKMQHDSSTLAWSAMGDEWFEMAQTEHTRSRFILPNMIRFMGDVRGLKILDLGCGEGGYSIAAINKDPENTQTMELRMLDDSVTEMRIHTVNGPSAESYNDIDKTEVGITVSEWMSFAGSVTLQPHSVNVIELR